MALRIFLKHGATIAQMDDILRRDCSAVVSWKTVRSKLIALSGIKLSFHSYCPLMNSLYQLSRENVNFLVCLQDGCTSSSTAETLLTVDIKERIEALLSSSKIGP